MIHSVIAGVSQTVDNGSLTEAAGSLRDRQAFTDNLCIARSIRYDRLFPVHLENGVANPMSLEQCHYHVKIYKLGVFAMCVFLFKSSYHVILCLTKIGTQLANHSRR